MTNYEIEQIERAEKNHNKEFKFHIMIYGTENKSNHLSITQEQLNKIKAIFAEVHHG